MSYKKVIKQKIIDNTSTVDINLFDGINVTQLGIYAPPGTEIILNNTKIVINQTGLLQIDNLDDSLAITELKITDVTKNHLSSFNAIMVIDYVGFIQ